METLERALLLLTSDEIESITGCKRRKQQIEWLKGNRWQFEVNARGVPIIARSYAEAHLSGNTGAPQATRPRRPNFEAISRMSSSNGSQAQH
jgi:hypothetical protein